MKRVAPTCRVVLVWSSCALACAGCSPDRRDRTFEPSPVTVPRTDAGEATDAPLRFIGVIAAGELANIAPRSPGVIRAVHVDAGDRVAVGDVIADMDPAEMRDQLRAAQAAVKASSAALTAAKVEAEDARRRLELEIKAVASGISPAQNVDEERVNLKRADAAVERARSTQAAEVARAQTARDQLADTALRAPFAGTVAMRFHDAGNRIEAGEPIARIVGNGKMTLRFAVPPEQARIIAVDGTVIATVNTITIPVSATIKQVSPALDPASGMIIVDAELDEESGELRPGLEAFVVPR